MHSYNLTPGTPTHHTGPCLRCCHEGIAADVARAKGFVSEGVVVPCVTREEALFLSFTYDVTFGSKLSEAANRSTFPVKFSFTHPSFVVVIINSTGEEFPTLREA